MPCLEEHVTGADIVTRRSKEPFQGELFRLFKQLFLCLILRLLQRTLLVMGYSGDLSVL